MSTFNYGDVCALKHGVSFWILIQTLQPTLSFNGNLNLYGHRGGVVQLVPEHTYASYALGAQEGAEYLEQDLVFSSDGELVVLHDVELSRTTDIEFHPEFANRTRTLLVWDRGDPDNYTNGQPISMLNYASNAAGWFVHDFTVAELKTLRKRSRSYPDDSPFNNIWSVMTFNESLEFVSNLSETLGRSIAVIPETKFSEWYRSLGFDIMEEKVLASLVQYGYAYIGDDGYAHPYYFNVDGDNETEDKPSVVVQVESISNPQYIAICLFVNFCTVICP